jgi:uncharacterized membrane protein required for colicin V production
LPFERHLESLLDLLQKIPPGTWATAGGAGFIAFAAGLAFARGVMGQILRMVSLLAAIFVAWLVFTHRTDVFGSIGTQMKTDRLLLISAGAGLLTFVLCQGAVHLLAGLGILRLMGGLAGWKGVAVSALPSGFLLWAATAGLRLMGDFQGMESAAAVAQGGDRIQSQAISWLDKLSKQMDRSTLGALAAQVDPFDMRATSNLARLLILWPDGSVWRRLAQDPKMSKALNHERIQNLGRDPKVRACIERHDFVGLIQLPQVGQAAGHPDLEPVLSGLALEDAMDSIIYKRQSIAKR